MGPSDGGVIAMCPSPSLPTHSEHGDDAPLTVIDPVCGMTVDPAKSPHHAEHEGRAFHFCSAGCRTKFVGDPER